MRGGLSSLSLAGWACSMLKKGDLLCGTGLCGTGFQPVKTRAGPQCGIAAPCHTFFNSLLVASPG